LHIANDWHPLSRSRPNAKANKKKAACTITAIYLREKYEIRFEIDGQDMGMCFNNINVHEVYPTVELYETVATTVNLAK
jgi:hypothetical protein